MAGIDPNELRKALSGLEMLLRIGEDQMGPMLDDVPRALDDMHRLLGALGKVAEPTPAVVRSVARSVRDLKVAKGLGEPAVERIVDLLRALDDPLQGLAKLDALPAKTLRAAEAVFLSDDFAKAVGENRKVLSTFVDLLSSRGDDAAELFKKGGGAQWFLSLTGVIDNVPDGAKRLIDLAKTKHFDAFAERGNRGFVRMIKVMDELVSEGATDAATKTLRLAEDLAQQFRARYLDGTPVLKPGDSRRLIVFDDIGEVHAKLGAKRFACYIESLDFFRREVPGVPPPAGAAVGTLIPGIITPASPYATANFATVASASAEKADAFALEVVGTRAVIEDGCSFFITARSAVDTAGRFPDKLKLQKQHIQAFGFKGTKSGRRGDNLRTLEADVLAEIHGVRYFIDWKRYASGAKVSPKTIRSALTALRNRVGPNRGPGRGLVDNVILAIPTHWGDEIKKLIRKTEAVAGTRLLLAEAQIPKSHRAASLLMRFLGIS